MGVVGGYGGTIAGTETCGRGQRRRGLLVEGSGMPGRVRASKRSRSARGRGIPDKQSSAVQWQSGISEGN